VKTTSRYLALGRSYNPKGGAPKGNRNALKSGRYTAEKRAMRRRIAGLIRRAHGAIAMVDESLRARRKALREAVK
jgi:hypothetical protein